MFGVIEQKKKKEKEKRIGTGYQHSLHSHFSSTFCITRSQLISFAQDSNHSIRQQYMHRRGESTVSQLGSDLDFITIWSLLRIIIYNLWVKGMVDFSQTNLCVSLWCLSDISQQEGAKSPNGSDLRLRNSTDILKALGLQNKMTATRAPWGTFPGCLLPVCQPSGFI